MIEYIGNDVFSVDRILIKSQYLYETLILHCPRFKEDIDNIKLETKNWMERTNILLLNRIKSVAIILSLRDFHITYTRIDIPETLPFVRLHIIYEDSVDIILRFTIKTDNLESIHFWFGEEDEIELKDISLPELIRILR